VRRYFGEIVECLVVQPKLDEVGLMHFVRTQLLRFKRKAEYMRDRRAGKNLHEFEIRAFRALGRTLITKAFTALKIKVKGRELKRQEE
jgi:hypothetical protein